MSATVWTVPDGYQDNDEQITAVKQWAVEQGIGLKNVAQNGFHITKEPDGTLTARYDEFCYSAEGFRELTMAGGFTKRPVTRTVTSLPRT